LFYEWRKENELREVDMSKVIPLRLKISNAFLITGKKLALVDTGSPKDTSALLGGIRKAGVNVQDLSLIIHTHAHFDHCGCTADLQRTTGALVAIHRSDSQPFSEGRSAPIVPINFMGRLLMPFMKGTYETAKANILIDDELDLHPYGVDGKAVATPGHTPGSISILLDTGEAIVGDLIGGGRLLGLMQPGRPRYHHWYSDLNTAKASIARVMNTDPTRVFVGHGGPLEGKAAARHFGKLQ
jgi:glyoxylase-like metal-dependent hydrolase (beta-lactamase superfamily II)